MKNIRLFGLAAILTILSLAFGIGCNFLPFLDSDPDGILTIYLENRLAPMNLDPGISLDVAAYDISGSGPSGATFTANGIAENAYTQTGLVPGSWTVTVVGRNDQDTAIVHDSGVVVVSVAEVSTLSLTCVPFSGNGDLTLEIGWPADSIGTPDVVAELKPMGDISTALSFTLGTDSATWTGTDLAEGYYTLNIELWDRYDTEKLCWNVVETVLILADHATNGSWNLVAEDIALFATGTIQLAIASDTQKPLELSLTGANAEFSVGSTMTVTASGAPAEAVFTWYLNGTPMDEETTASVTVGSGLSSGRYWLYGVAEAGGVAGSAGCTFLVTTPEVPTDSLIVEWLFSGDADDTSGNSTNGTVNGAILAVDRFGNASAAYDFDGVDDYIESATSAGLTLSESSSFTLSVWVSPDRLDKPTGMIVDGGPNSYTYKYALALLNVAETGFVPKYDCQVAVSGIGADRVLSLELTDTGWSHLVLAYDNLSLTFYVDGELIGSTTFTNTGWGSTLNQIVVGHIYGQTGSTFAFDGKIDDIRVYSRVLTAAEIYALFSVSG